MAQFPSHGQAANGGTTEVGGVLFYPAPALQGAPLPAGLFRGYEVTAGHPACMPPPTPPALPTSRPAADDGGSRPISERRPRAKRAAHDMESHDSIDPRAVPADGKSGASPEPLVPTAAPGGAKRPFLAFRPAVWMHPAVEHWEASPDLAQDDEACTQTPPAPQVMTPQEARQLLDRLDGLAKGDDARFLRDIRDALRHDVLRRRRHFVDDGAVAASTYDQLTVASALVERWGGAALSDDRLDLIAHVLSSKAGLVLLEDQGDLENANFLRGVLSAVPAGSETHTRWIRRILQEGFSAAHADHPAYPLVGQGTLRMLLWALLPRKVSKETLFLVLDTALLPRGQVPPGDARRAWRGSDLQMAMAAARHVLRDPRGHEVHPLLAEWLGQAGQFSSDELSFLAAGLFAEWPLREHDPQASAVDKGQQDPRIANLQRMALAFLCQSTLKGGRLAAAAFGLTCGLRSPRFVLEGRVLVDSMNEASLASVSRGAARLAIAVGDSQVARRVATSLMQWTHKRAWLPADSEDRQAWMRSKRGAVGTFLNVLAPHLGPQALPTLMQELRERVYESQALSVAQARQVLDLILPRPAPGVSSQEWEAHWQHKVLMQVLTAGQYAPVPDQ